MKRLFTALAASLLLLTACGEESSAARPTIIPSNESMQSAMEARGYKTTVLGDYEQNGYTLFSASNGADLENFDGVMVMRAKNAADIESQESKTQSAESEHTIIFVKKNDPELGNLLVMGTEEAIEAAGITLGD